MTIRERILAALRSGDRLCDDCLPEATGVRPRQTVDAECRRMRASQILARATEDCARCQRIKLINFFTGGGIGAGAARRTLHGASGGVPKDRDPRREHEDAGDAPTSGVTCYCVFRCDL
jgi:hypothetical protein